MKPLFIGSHPALDFLNTSLAPQGTQIELIGDGKSLVEWVVEAGLLDAVYASSLMGRFNSKDLDAAATEARYFRKWVDDWVARWHHAPASNYQKELDHINKILERARFYRKVLTVSDSLQVQERCHIDSADKLITLVAAQVALLIANEQAPLVKRCAGSGCTLWFLDKTKAHRRLFCSAEVCGNRAKVAAFRERQRAK